MVLVIGRSPAVRVGVRSAQSRPWRPGAGPASSGHAAARGGPGRRRLPATWRIGRLSAVAICSDGMPGCDSFGASALLPVHRRHRPGRAAAWDGRYRARGARAARSRRLSSPVVWRLIKRLHILVVVLPPLVLHLEGGVAVFAVVAQ